MSKVISFSISDRYLDKLRSLYPSLTDNLAVKQFVTDRLNSSLGNSLDGSLDDGLDDRVKTLIESWVDGLLDERLDATVGKLLTSLSERMARLEARLDDSLDGRLDDMERLLKLQQSASIASPLPTGEPSPLPPSPSLPPDKLGEGGNGDTPEVPPSPPSPPGTDAIASIDGTVESVEPNSSIETVAIEDSEKKITLLDTSIASPIETVESGSEPGTDAIETLPTVETVSTDSSIETVASAIATDDREWLTLQQIADKKIKGLPGTHQGLRPYAENWEWRENPTKKGKQYKIPKEYL